MEKGNQLDKANLMSAGVCTDRSSSISSLSSSDEVSDKAFARDALPDSATVGKEIEAQVCALTGAGMVFSWLEREASKNEYSGGSLFKSLSAGVGHAGGFLFNTEGDTFSVDFRASDFTIFPDGVGAMDAETGVSTGTARWSSAVAGEL